ncbi:epiglycanin precursor [Diplodia corticola]|uniref:Epiglycanin n=1 Tax=Diplodia corticola TaxID=236234 RepID=A0A1J9RQ16_9PEZI|nr:epiglycanin precursor [Diplodia corticola]OJD30004.1 epiglycanin precursor [Diplodia corticola]
MTLVYAWLAFLASILPAIAQETIVSTASTTTVTVDRFISVTVPGWTATVTGPTVTVTALLGCTSSSVSASHPAFTTHPASTHYPDSAAPVPSGFSCPTGGELVQVVSGTSTLWPCGAPGPTDSITIIPGHSTFTVAPSEETTTEVWVTGTQYLTATDPAPSEAPLTATVWVTDSEEPTTVIIATTYSTVFLGTSTTSDDSLETGSPSKAPASSKATVSTHASSDASSYNGWSSHGWNSSTHTPGPQSSGNRTGVIVVTGEVPTTPFSHSIQPSTRTVTVTLARNATTSVGLSSVIEPRTATANGAISTLTTFSKHANASSTTRPMATASALCGEGCDCGNFTIDFDEDHGILVNASDPYVGINSTDHHLRFNEGFVYVPPDYDAVSPASPPYLAMYMPNMTRDSHENGSLPNGGIGPGGNRVINSAFHFNAYGGSFSCEKGPISQDNAPEPLNCTLEVSGLRWIPETKEEKLHAISTFGMAPCSEATEDEECKCELTKVDFSSEGGDYTDLSSIRIKAYYWNDPDEDRVFFMDDLQLGWTDNSLAAGLIRGQDI